MRICPPVPAIARQLSTEVTVDGVTLLPGTLIDMNIYSIHHNSTVWGNDHNVGIYAIHSLSELRQLSAHLLGVGTAVG